VQEGTDLTQNEVRSLKEVGFVINKHWSIQPWSLSGGKNMFQLHWLFISVVSWAIMPNGETIQ
jgi:hypothetical protein